MMIAICVALVAVAIAMLIGMFTLRSYFGALRAKEQCFRFHELRDRLQMLLIDGKIGRGSDVYEFLQLTINLGIKNAGDMKLRQILGLARQLNQKIAGVPYQNIFEEIRQQSPDVQSLFGDIFQSLAAMVISNDKIVFIFTVIAESSSDIVGGAARSCVRTIVRTLMPDYSEAARSAREYQHLGRTMSFHQST